MLSELMTTYLTDKETSVLEFLEIHVYTSDNSDLAWFKIQDYAISPFKYSHFFKMNEQKSCWEFLKDVCYYP